MSHTLINCTCKNRLCFSLLPFTLIPQYLKRFNWSKTRQNKRNLETKQWNPPNFRLFPLASMISWCFQTVRRMPEARKQGTYVRSQSFRPSRQSNVSTSGEERFKYPLPWENKISQMPYPRVNNDNQIPTPCPVLPPSRRHDIDRCIIQSIIYKWRIIRGRRGA